MALKQALLFGLPGLENVRILVLELSYAATRAISAVDRYDCYVSVFLHGERSAGKGRWQSGPFLLRLLS
jgi:hypothetical protein